MHQNYNPIHAFSISDLTGMSIADINNWDQKLSFLEERCLAEGSLYEFFKAAWPYIEGNMPYVDSWHIRAIAEHLEAVYVRQIREADH
jgi:hypothetical protein